MLEVRLALIKPRFFWVHSEFSLSSLTKNRTQKNHSRWFLSNCSGLYCFYMFQLTNTQTVLKSYSSKEMLRKTDRKIPSPPSSVLVHYLRTNFSCKTLRMKSATVPEKLWHECITVFGLSFWCQQSTQLEIHFVAYAGCVQNATVIRVLSRPPMLSACITV